MRPLRTVGVFLVALTACANGTDGEPSATESVVPRLTVSPSPTATPTPSVAAAPWSSASVESSEASPVLLEQWRAAPNRDECAALHTKDAPGTRESVARRANFSGGWAVAYDKPGAPGRDASGDFCPSCGRGAFGVAGTGATKSASDVAPGRWPFEIRYADDSAVGYGAEGSTTGGGESSDALRRASSDRANWNGPVSAGGNTVPWLAYVSITSQGCLYNVWSFEGKGHLEALVQSLRFVRGVGAPG